MLIIGQQTAVEPIRDGHQGGIDSGNVNPLYIEQYGGEVEKRFLKKSFMRQFFKFKSVRGTDTITNDRMGSTSLQKVSRGIRPTDSAPTFDNISVKVDTLVLARTTQFLLDDFLSHINVRKEVGEEHGKEIGKFFDEAFLVQGIKAAQITNKDPEGTLLGGWTAGGVYDQRIRTAPKDFQGATPLMMAAAADELDAEALVQRIHNMCQAIEEKDVDIEGAVILLRPAQYYVLLENDKLLNTEFSTANGDYAQGSVMKVNGIRVQTTNRFPKVDQVGETHFLSNAGNGNAYDVTQDEVDCVAVLLMPKALLAGETIPLTSKVYYDNKELQWFIDSYLSFGVTPNRAEMAAALFKFRSA